MFKIGEFSKLVQVSVPTLRYYDQLGLLKPVEVDRFTGYRFYAASQLPRLNRILALKGLGFSLEQIGAVLDEGLTPEQMRGMLRLRHAQINQELLDVQSHLVEVEVRLQQIEGEGKMSNYDVLLKQVEPQQIASIRAILPKHSDIGPLYGEICAELGARVADVGLTLAIWYDEDFKDHDVDGAAAFILRGSAPDSGRMHVQDLPAAAMVATVHHGAYATINDAYQAVLKWIEANGYRIAGPSREVYLHNTMPIRQDDASYVTEVQFPVEKVATTA